MTYVFIASFHWHDLHGAEMHSSVHLRASVGVEARALLTAWSAEVLRGTEVIRCE